MDSNFYKMIGDAIKNGKTLTEKNLTYVCHCAEQISKQTGVDFYDLFSEGVEAMQKCENKYDPEKNDNFCKFCGSSIRGYMMNFVNRQTNLVHIPVNHMQGFKAGQKKKSDAESISYDYIDSNNYDTLELIDDNSEIDRFNILQECLSKLDENGRIAIKMKLRLGEYANLKKNSMAVIANELEVPLNVANKIYKEAFKKLSKYCQMEYNS